MEEKICLPFSLPDFSLSCRKICQNEVDYSSDVKNRILQITNNTDLTVVLVLWCKLCTFMYFGHLLD